MASLESLVFGFDPNQEDTKAKKRTEEKQQRKAKQPGKESKIQEEIEHVTDDVTEIQPEAAKPAVWRDEDDEISVPLPKSLRQKRRFERVGDAERARREALDRAEYEKRLRQDFEKAHGRPAWADKKQEKASTSSVSSDSEEEQDVLRISGRVLKVPKALPRGKIRMTQLEELNRGFVIKNKAITNVEFHKTSPICLVAGRSQNLQLFKIDKSKSTLLTSVGVDRFTMDTVRFSADGTKVILGSRIVPHFYVYDMEGDRMLKIPQVRAQRYQRRDKFAVSPDAKLVAFQGLFGYIHLLSATTYEEITTVKVNSELRSLTFSKDGNYLYAYCDNGLVYIWETSSRKCMHSFRDEGCIHGSCIELSQNFLACGSNTGVVNLYELPDVHQQSEPKPRKTFMNLVTETDSVKMNFNEEILAMASQHLNDAVKLAHVSSNTVFSDFPSKERVVSKVMTLDFSPGSKYLAVGNFSGSVKWFRLLHYDEY